MENNKKGNLLYLVLGVATLVVAVIGATFAFFSASATNNNITGNVAEAGGLLLDVKSITYDPTDPTYQTTTGSNIIPLNLITNQTPILGGDDGETVTGYVDATSQFAQAMDRKCRDDLGNNICEVYQITVTNQSATATIQIRGTLNLTSVSPNMHWKLIDATTEDKTYTPEEGEAKTITILSTATEQLNRPAVKQGSELAKTYLTSDVVNTGSEAEPVYASQGKNISLTGTNGNTPSATFYVVVWLEEIGDEQQDEDAGNSYSGTITFDAVDAAGNKSGVTATFLS